MSFNYTAIDLETANGQRGSICQIGLARIRDGLVESTMSTLIRPAPELGSFSPVHTRIHGIGWADVRDAPSFGQVQQSLLDYIGNDHLVAHNAAFERSALRQVGTLYRLPLPNWQFLCTIKIAKRVLPDLPRYRLPVVLERLGMSPGKHHDALADAIDAARILQGCASITGDTSIPELLVRTYVRPDPL